MKRFLAATLTILATLCIVRYSTSVDTKPMKAGETWTIQLNADPAGRYQWQAIGYNDQVISVSTQTQNNQTIITVRANKAGRSNLRLEYRRPDSPQKPSQVQEYIVSVG